MHLKGTKDYTCDRCGCEAAAKKIPFGWRCRGGDHICPGCWPTEPAERACVMRYHVSRENLHIPDQFWTQQRAAAEMWSGMLAVDLWALSVSDEMRRVAAPMEAAEVDRLCAELETCSDEEKIRTRVSIKRARTAVKRSAKLAGCDEKPVWIWREAQIKEAPVWRYRETSTRFRARVDRVQSGGFRLAPSLAYQIVGEYQTAFREWIRRRAEGRGLPRLRHGIGDRVRAVMLYSDGSTLDSLRSGTPSLTLTDLPGVSRSGRPTVRIDMAVGCGAHMSGVVVLHRPLPEEQKAIRRVELVGRRWANMWDWSLCVTCRGPLGRLPGAHDKAVAVDLRWRHDPARPQDLVVAFWRDANDDGAAVRIDTERSTARQDGAELYSSHADYVRLQQVDDADLEKTKARVWMSVNGDASYSRPFRLLRSRGLWRNREQYPGAAEDIAAWHARHETVIRRLARLRTRLIGRRDQTYYTEAHRICGRAKWIVIEADVKQEDIRPMSIKALAEGDNPAGGQRQLLAPGRFRSILLDVARRHGCEIVMVDKVDTSRPCPRCGVLADTGTADTRCDRCGLGFSRPEAAITELMRRLRRFLVPVA